MTNTTVAGIWTLSLGTYVALGCLTYTLLGGVEWLELDGRVVCGVVWPLVLPVVLVAINPGAFVIGLISVGGGLLSYSTIKRAVMSFRKWINPEPMPPDYRDRLVEEEAKREVEKLIS
jgi:hypothetical protein